MSECGVCVCVCGGGVLKEGDCTITDPGILPETPHSTVDNMLIAFTNY